jgi:predicted oxidoreductase
VKPETITAAASGTFTLGGDLAVRRLGFGAMRLTIDTAESYGPHVSEVDYCERETIGFIPWFPLQVGKLAEDPTLAQIARQVRATPSQVALAWLLQRSPVMRARPA